MGTALETLDHEVVTAVDRVSTLSALRSETAPIDSVLLDLRLGTESGLDLLTEVLRLTPRLPVIVVTAYAAVDTAVEAMRRGAFDYISKPCTPDQLREAMEKVERARILDEQLAERDDGAHAVDLPELDLSIGSASTVMQDALSLAFNASSDAALLLLGESGTGKSALARAIHRRGPRATGAFVTLNCEADAREILDLDAPGGKPPKIAAAEGGTLYLDEISALPLEAQARLLRLLQERDRKPGGESGTPPAGWRVVAATSQDLQKAMKAGKFRSDLFYHLSVITITLPPLRARTGEIESLVGAYLSFFARHYARPLKHLSSRALRKLQEYQWPGNLSELRNVLERAVILSNGCEIDITELPNAIRFAYDNRADRKSTLEEVQNEHIRHVLANTSSLQEASAVLGIDVATLYRKRRKLGV